MAPKSKPEAENKRDIIANLEKLKNGEQQHIKIDLTKINIKTLARSVGVISEDVKVYMKFIDLKRYYALNDRIINLLLKGEIDMSSTYNGETKPPTVSDQEIVDLLAEETNIEVFRVEKIKPGQGVLSSNI